MSLIALLKKKKGIETYCLKTKCWPLFCVRFFFSKFFYFSFYSIRFVFVRYRMKNRIFCFYSLHVLVVYPIERIVEATTRYTLVSCSTGASIVCYPYLIHRNFCHIIFAINFNAFQTLASVWFRTASSQYSFFSFLSQKKKNNPYTYSSYSFLLYYFFFWFSSVVEIQCETFQINDFFCYLQFCSAVSFVWMFV